MGPYFSPTRLHHYAGSKGKSVTQQDMRFSIVPSVALSFLPSFLPNRKVTSWVPDARSDPCMPACLPNA